MKQSNTGLLQFMKACKSEVEQRLDELVRPSRDDSAHLRSNAILTALRWQAVAPVLMIAVADVVLAHMLMCWMQPAHWR